MSDVPDDLAKLASIDPGVVMDTLKKRHEKDDISLCSSSEACASTSASARATRWHATPRLASPKQGPTRPLGALAQRSPRAALELPVAASSAPHSCSAAPGVSVAT